MSTKAMRAMSDDELRTLRADTARAYMKGNLKMATRLDNVNAVAAARGI